MQSTKEKFEKQKVHVAFQARSQEEVNAFYQASLAEGGKDNGPPGPRPEYTHDYYGAFVYDLDGNNIEAVYRSEYVYDKKE